MHPALKDFHPAVSGWFEERFETPTEPQIQGWPEISSGKDTLIAAPTGSGKTLAAFLSCIDRLFREGSRGRLKDQTSILYVSPLKALGNDIQKNLDEPLAQIRARAAKQWEKLPEIRTAVRSGDTTPGERAAMLKKPPHILITTPESLYLLLTSKGGREMLKTVKTVIVDEIHAVARDKRGSHLALSLERLDRLTKKRSPRIGLSATQKPIEEIARYLVGTAHLSKDGKPDCAIVDAGHRRKMDLEIEIPKDELGAVASKELWAEVYERVSELVNEHKSTLVFVNTRRMVERVTHALEKKLGAEAVAAHHGSLSKEMRLKAETRLKSGATKAVVATASLELGIDVGAVDLVCHIGSPRSLAVGLQRIGRSGHGRLVIPKARLFPVTRDELIECAAFVRGVRRGNLEKTKIPFYPLDILAQQIVAMVACEDMAENDVFRVVRGAWPYARLPREEFDKVVLMLSEGISTARGARGAWLHRDGVTHELRPRRGARLTAITSGGAIPDNFTYAVVKEPEGITVGSLEEDFAVESMSGDIFLLGNHSWRILRVEAGRVRVEDAAGQAPTIPFWLGEAPGRSAELSAEVSDLRKTIEPLLDEPEKAVAFLENECGVPRAGATQAVAYLSQSKAALGRLPTQETLIAERFFDEGGGMQLVIHAPFGGRLNRAFGLALRKKFCAGFNFELQAAATDDGILLSLGPQHSFPLESVFDFVTPATAKETLEQAVLDAPVFGVRWRWNASRALALLRHSGGKRVPPGIQRMRSDDLLAAAFPDQAACQENVTRPIKIPDHPLVTETMRNCLYEAMDLKGLTKLLERIQKREVQLIAKDTPTPSPLTHEILNSNPYTYLDDAPLEERRARAVATRRTLSEDDLRAFGALDTEAIASVESEIRPDVRSEDELADTLREFVLMPEASFPRAWTDWKKSLIASGRAVVLGEHVVSVDRKDLAEKALNGDEEAAAAALRSWMMAGGPLTAAQWAERLGLEEKTVDRALLRLEAAGTAIRGRFRQEIINQPRRGVEGEAPTALPVEGATQAPIIEWCDRDVLARIHRRCLGQLRKSMEPATTVEFLRYLLRWQHVAPGTQVYGAHGLAEVIGQLQGLQLPAAAWEKEIFPARVADYHPSMLDELCLHGTVVWGRLIAGKEEGEEDQSPKTKVQSRRQVPHRNTTLSIMLREDLPWLLSVTRPKEAAVAELGESALKILEFLETRGAMFFNDLQALTGRLRTDLDQALWELVAAGMITCDGFAGLRNLANPSRRREKMRLLARYPGSRGPMFMGPGGRWSLLRPDTTPAASQGGVFEENPDEAMLAQQYLRRWGIVFRDLLSREPAAPPWRVLLSIYRRLEARGEIRGGRFVSGFSGEQFALPEAVEALRSARRTDARDAGARVEISAADPLNVTGYVTPVPRTPATPGNRVTFVGGKPLLTQTG
ncbi:MAG TPA: DEAD/DEAH box helicase [bacterium]|nr:DEAD/DEAH box helicase [bacterium]